MTAISMTNKLKIVSFQIGPEIGLIDTKMGLEMNLSVSEDAALTQTEIIEK